MLFLNYSELYVKPESLLADLILIKRELFVISYSLILGYKNCIMFFMFPVENPVVEAILYEAIHSFRSSENLKSAVQQVILEPKRLNYRIAAFDYNLDTLNSLIRQPEDKIEDDPHLPIYYLHTLSLKRVLASLSLPSINGIVSLINDYHEQEVLRMVRKTCLEINQNALSDRWKFLNQEKDVNKLITGTLIEGYGLFLEKLYPDLKDMDLRQTFVCSFEEVLIINNPVLLILKDAIDWMNEDKMNFTAAVREQVKLRTQS